MICIFLNINSQNKLLALFADIAGTVSVTDVQVSLAKSLETSVHFNFAYGGCWCLSKMISKLSNFKKQMTDLC